MSFPVAKDRSMMKVVGFCCAFDSSLDFSLVFLLSFCFLPRYFLNPSLIFDFHALGRSLASSDPHGCLSWQASCRSFIGTDRLISLQARDPTRPFSRHSSKI